MLAYRLPHSLSRVSYNAHTKVNGEMNGEMNGEKKGKKRRLDIHGFADILWALDCGNVVTELVP